MPHGEEHSPWTNGQSGRRIIVASHGTTYADTRARELVILPTHLLHGTEYERLVATADRFRKVLDAGYAKVQLRPLMLVAGAHANKDMAGSRPDSGPDSWKGRFEAAGIQATAQIRGLGQIAAVRQVDVRHVAGAMSHVI